MKYNEENPKIAFFGTPQMCVPLLESLKKSGITPALVVTNPDRRAGRGMKLTETPVKGWATQNEIPVLTPDKLNSGFLGELQKEKWDLFVVVAYGKIFPEELIDIPEKMTINIHYSLLPKYRGAAPVEAAILGEEKETGITIQKMAFKMDAGDILYQESINIKDEWTAPELFEKLNTMASEKLPEVVKDILEDKEELVSQDESKVSFAPKIEKSSGELIDPEDHAGNWTKYRAYIERPGVFYTDSDGKRVKIKNAELSSGKFEIKSIVKEGESETPYDGSFPRL